MVGTRLLEAFSARAQTKVRMCSQVDRLFSSLPLECKRVRGHGLMPMIADFLSFHPATTAFGNRQEVVQYLIAGHATRPTVDTRQFLQFSGGEMDMKIVKTALVVFALLLLGAMLAPGARAQSNEYKQKSIVTFSEPVEIPGQILPAGTYTIELVDAGPGSYRHIVRFFNADQTRVVATVLAIPNLRLKATDKPVMTFTERPINSPEALKAWFYSGNTWGHEFVYPRQRALELAQVVREPVLAIPTATTNIEELKTAPVVAITPERREVPLTEVVEIPATPVLVAQNRTPAPLAQTQQLPKTASMLPLMTLLGVGALGFAFVLKRIAG